MANNKKFYWLKLKEDFFDDDTIAYIEEQENGILYVNFYLKLCLKSLKTEGSLIRLVGENLIPYDINSLAKLTRTPVDTVRVAMALFEQIGLVKILETGEIYLSQINEMIGSETDKASIMRRKRAKEKLKSNNVTQLLPECYTEIEIEKEIDKDIKKEKKKKETEFDVLIKENFTNEEVINTIYEFIKMRKAIKKPLTTRGLELIIKKLYKMTTNVEEQIEILNNSIMNNWQGIFEIKKENKVKNNNSNQRDYDNLDFLYANLSEENKI